MRHALFLGFRPRNIKFVAQPNLLISNLFQVGPSWPSPGTLKRLRLARSGNRRRLLKRFASRQAFCPSSPPTRIMSNKTRGRQTREQAFHQGKFFMNRAHKKLGTTIIGGTEDRRFRSFFGCSVEVFLVIWHLIISNELLPLDCCFSHLFWAFLFMKIYPKNEAALCSLLGGVDPKTMRKRVWPLIRAVAELHFIVVSAIQYVLFSL